MKPSKSRRIDHAATECRLRTLFDAPESCGSDELPKFALLRLAEAEWRPTLSLRSSIELLLGGEGETLPRRSGLQAYLDGERAHRASIEQFARDAWAMPLPERERAWRKLFDESREFPALRARMAKLNILLSVDLPEGLPAPFDRLASLAAQWLASRPAERVTVRRSIVEQLPCDPTERFQVIDRFRASAPLLAEKCSSLFSDFRRPDRKPGTARSRRRTKLRVERRPPVANLRKRERASGVSTLLIWVFVAAAVAIAYKISPPKPAHEPIRGIRGDPLNAADQRSLQSVLQRTLNAPAPAIPIVPRPVGPLHSDVPVDSQPHFPEVRVPGRSVPRRPEMPRGTAPSRSMPPVVPSRMR